MKSHWYERAAHVIDEVLRKLPADADDATIKKTVDEAYPFGPREHWPYKKWLEARKNVLAARFPSRFPKKVKEQTGPLLFAWERKAGKS